MATHAQVRREGMADAVVLLVAARVRRVTVEECATALGLQQSEVKAAIGRLRARHTRKPKAPGTVPCTHEGCDARLADNRGLAAHLRSHERRTCDYCGLSFIWAGLGPHRKSCSQRPVAPVDDATAVTA